MPAAPVARADPGDLVPAISTTRLTKTYGGRTVVDAVDLRVPAQRLTALLGPNGSGKTTTMAMLLGLVRPTGGAVNVLGGPAGTVEPGRVGAMVNGPAFYPNLTARRNLRVLATLAGGSGSGVERVLAQVGLTEAAGRRVAGFSLGMRQRLGLAAALLTEPDLLVLDEPSNGLDPLAARELRTLLRTLVDRGATVIVSTHLLNDVDDTCDYVVVMDAGRVVFQGDRSSFGAGSQFHHGQVLLSTDQGGGAALARLLSELGFRAVLDGRHVRVDAPPEASGRLNREAVLAGFTVTELRIERASVETLFHSLIGPGAPR